MVETNSNEQNTPIYIEDVSGITLGKGLELLLTSVSGNPAELDYVVKDGIIIIGTKASLPRKMATQTYDVSDLVISPAAFTSGAETGSARGRTGERAVRSSRRDRRTYGRRVRRRTR